VTTRRRDGSGADGETFEVPVTLGVFGASPTGALAIVRRRSLVSRVGRASLALGAAWLLVFPAIFFPVLHFVLVPGLAVGGVVLAMMRLREDLTLGRVRGICPRCMAALDLTPGGRFRLPRPVRCGHCKNELTVAAAARAVGSDRPAE